MPVNPKKLKKQQEVLKELGIKPQDLEEKFVLSSGPGGQKINKKASAVHLRHLPSGLEARASEERSLQTNRYIARQKLIEAYKSRILGLKTKYGKRLEKLKKQKKRRKRKAAQKYSSGNA